jgi:hypothetical protein
MFPIAYITQIQMRRSLAGARASDPVVPERRRRPRRAGRTSSHQPRGLASQAGCAPASTSGASA